MLNIIEVLLVLVIFFPVKYLCFQITDKWGLPEWLRYKPWECYKCLSFWLLMALFLSCGLLFNLYITMAVGTLMTVLDAVAMTIDQRQKTIRI